MIWIHQLCHINFLKAMATFSNSWSITVVAKQYCHPIFNSAIFRSMLVDFDCPLDTTQNQPRIGSPWGTVKTGLICVHVCGRLSWLHINWCVKTQCTWVAPFLRQRAVDSMSKGDQLYTSMHEFNLPLLLNSILRSCSEIRDCLSMTDSILEF